MLDGGRQHLGGAEDVGAGDRVVEHVDRDVGAHLQSAPNCVLGVGGSDRQGDHLARATVVDMGLEQGQCRLDGVLVELIERPVATVTDHAPVGSDAPLGLDVGHVLDAHHDSHQDNPLSAAPDGRGLLVLVGRSPTGKMAGGARCHIRMAMGSRKK